MDRRSDKDRRITNNPDYIGPERRSGKNRRSGLDRRENLLFFGVDKLK